MYFSSYLVDSSDYIGNLPYIPQLESKENGFVLSKDGWTLLEDTYIANGNEQFIIIGNFRNNAETNWIRNPNGVNTIAYYYIDNVNIIEIDTDPDEDFLLLNYDQEFQRELI